MKRLNGRFVLTGLLVLVIVAGLVVVLRTTGVMARTTVTAYFENSNGIFAGDDVLVLGVPVGRIDRIEPQPQRVKITFWYDSSVSVPADVKAAIISPQLVTGRAIQLTPAYTGGPRLSADAVIPLERTAIPVSWDDFRVQLEKLTQTLQPDHPGGVSALGEFINTAADNLRGEGGNIREALIKLSQTMSVLGDHKDDIFSTLTNLSTLVSALHGTTDLLGSLNRNLAGATALLADDPDEVGNAAAELRGLADDVHTFAVENRDALGMTADTAASITTALVESLDDIKQTLHVAPTTLANFNNIYEPANGSLTGALAVNNFANPVEFICGAVEAAARLGAEHSAKLCAQYLAPIFKNRQYNFPPLGENLFVGTQARPNEITYSEDRLRPDYIPQVAPAAASGTGLTNAAPLAAEADLGLPTTTTTDPGAGLPGLMVPAGEGR